MRLVAFSSLCLACGPTIAPREQPPVVVLPSAQPSLAAPPPQRPAATKLELAEAACRAETRTIYSVADDHRLCDASLQSCFLAIDPIQPREMGVAVGIGEPPLGFVEVRHRGLALRGFASASNFVLFPVGGLVMGGFFRPTLLHIAAAKAGAFVVTGDPGPDVSPSVPLRLELSCDEVTWGQHSWTEPGEFAKMVGATGPEQSASLSGGIVELAPAPGGVTVATLTGPDLGASAYQTEKGFRFIVMWTNGGQVFGWVPATRVVTAVTGTGHGASGAGRGFVPIRSEWRGRRCDAAVPVFVRIAATLFEAGSIEAGSVFDVGKAIDDDQLELVVHHQRFTDGGTHPELRTMAHFHTIEGATLVVLRHDVSSCAYGVPGEPGR